MHIRTEHGHDPSGNAVDKSRPTHMLILLGVLSLLRDCNFIKHGFQLRYVWLSTLNTILGFHFTSCFTMHGSPLHHKWLPTQPFASPCMSLYFTTHGCQCPASSPCMALYSTTHGSQRPASSPCTALSIVAVNVDQELCLNVCAAAQAFHQ